MIKSKWEDTVSAICEYGAQEAVNMSESKYKKQIEAIRRLARDYDGKISYMIAADLLKESVKGIPEDELLQVMEKLSAEGIIMEEDEGYSADSGRPDTFVPADVHISNKTMTIWNLLERLQYDEIDLQPDFQRNPNLWDEEKQSRLIESLMLKIPIPAFYFDASNDERWNVIDGLQRLTAFRNFLLDSETLQKLAADAGENNGGLPTEPYKLKGLQYMSQFDDCTFWELPRQYQRRIREAQIIAYTVDKGTPSAIVFNIFQRINTGGVRLEDQEIRNAMYQGEATKLIKRLARSEEFLQATQHAISTERMMDQEYITRYLAFTELPLDDYKENIDTFLVDALCAVNQYPEEELQNIEQTFKRTMNLCYAIFGRYAFRTFRQNGRRGKINKALFELWSICFHSLAEQKMAVLLDQKGKFMKDFGELLETEDFRNALGSGKISAVRKRIALGKELVERYI